MADNPTCYPALQSVYSLIDTHTHFDDYVFDKDRATLAELAYVAGVQHLVLIGYLAKYFDRMQTVYHWMNGFSTERNKLLVPTSPRPQAYLASGLHPAYIDEHTEHDLVILKQFVQTYPHVAIGEIGLDTFTTALKTDAAQQKQRKFFVAQLDLAVQTELPVLLHIRKAHAQCLSILKVHAYDAHKFGGIAHSFSGGEQEAKAFVRMGFKLGVTGQITNPNAKKLRRAIKEAVDTFGLDCLVLETDCPDMTPQGCQQDHGHTRNVPANLAVVLLGLSEFLDVDPDELAQQLWHNSCQALKVDWPYSKRL